METITALKTSIVFGRGRCSGKLRNIELKEGRKNCRGLISRTEWQDCDSDCVLCIVGGGIFIFSLVCLWTHARFRMSSLTYSLVP